MLSLLFACSETTEKEPSLEQRISNVLEDNQVPFDSIIEYDLKDNFIFVIYKSVSMGALGVSAIEDTKDGLVLRNNRDGAAPDTIILGEEGTPFVTVVLQGDLDIINQVTILGKPARQVTYTESPMEGVTIERTYWVAYTHTAPNFTEDIDIMRE
jgi:hypothetical protein